MVKRLLLLALVVIGLSAAPAQAAPILTTDTTNTDEFIGVVLFDMAFNPVLMSLSPGSLDIAAVTNPALVTSGVIAAFDATTGAFVDFALDDQIAFTFNFGSSVFGGGTWSLLVAGAPISMTDPLLLPFLVANNVGQFTLFGDLLPIIDGETQQQTGILATYRLDFIAAPEDVSAVPEPATLALVGTGLAYAARRRRSKKAA